MHYASIKSVLAQIALILNDRYWNETTVLEHATVALRALNLESKLHPKVATLEVVAHKAELPKDFKYLIQAAYNKGTSTSTAWEPLRLTTNPYHNSICSDLTITRCDNCANEFSIDPSGVITTTLDEGTLLVAYLGYPVDSDGYALIPDDENVKEAIQHFVLYKY